MTNSQTALLAYVPVLHRGYVDFFKQNLDHTSTLIIIDRSLLEFARPIHKDIRALKAQQVKSAVESWQLFEQILVLDSNTDLSVLDDFSHLIIPEDDVLREWAKQNLSDKKIEWQSVFLRWDTKTSLAQKSITPQTQITHQELHQQLMGQAVKEKDKSADWWRQIGALIAKNGQVLLTAHNHHLPDEQQPYFDGSPRGNFHKGEQLEISTALHAEQDLITTAVKQGLSLAGTDLYVTTFPCPICAKLVANSGIKRIFFQDGYSLVDGEGILKKMGVEVIQVVG